MPLLIDDLATQMLEQTRVVTNAPLLPPNEPLRVEVIPGGGAGAQLTNDLLNALGTTPNEALRIDVDYEIRRGDEVLPASGYVRLPVVAAETVNPDHGALTDLLSVAFLLPPRVRLVNRPVTGPPPPAVLPALDHRLVVTITVRSTATVLTPAPSRRIEVPFTVPTIEVGLPLPGGICICSENANLGVSSGESLVMLAPGAPATISQAAESYNQLISTINSLEAVFGAAAVLLKPLQLVVDALGSIPEPEVTTDEWVKDFDDFGDWDGFDDEMRSFLLVAPTDWAIEFSDTANIGDWDDLSSHCLKTYTAVDLLQLPTHAQGAYLLARLGMDATALTTVRDRLATLTGATTASVRLGIGVFFVHDLTSGDTPNPLRVYDNCPGTFLREHADEWGDCESARWKVT